MTNEIQHAPRHSPAVVQAVESRIERVLELLPSQIQRQRFQQTLMIHVASNKALHTCEPGSVVLSAYRLASLGLTPGVDGHLVPRKGVCTFIADWKGLAKILILTGVVRDHNCSLVYEHEPFTLGAGRMVLNHTPSLNPRTRGALIGIYWIFRLPNGGEIHEVMDMEDAERLRRRGAQNGPWSTDFEEMLKKGCFKRAVKRLPIDPEMRAAIDSEGDEELLQRAPRAPIAIDIDEESANPDDEGDARE